MISVVMSIILGIVILGLCLVPIFMILRNGRTRREVTVISSDAARKHIALVWLIRAGEALFVGPLLLLALMIGFGFVVSINPFQRQPVYGAVYSVVMLIIVLVVSTFLIGSARHRFLKFDSRDLILKFQRVTSNSVSNFSFVFAALSAHDVYQLMLAKLPKSIPGISQALLPFLDRNLLWIFIFWGLWRLTYAVLLRVLELNHPAPRKEPPIDPDIPEFPQKSPLVQL
jgi:hypothetical protein